MPGEQRLATLPATNGPRPEGGLPPFDAAAEEAIIAALVLDPDAIYRVQYLVRPDDFFREQNAWCYEAATYIAARGDEVTTLTLVHELARSGRLDDVGGEPYIVEITGKYFTAVGVEAHAHIVARDALYRRVIQSASQGAQLAYEGGPDPGRVLAVLADNLALLQGSAALSGTVTLRDVVGTIDEDALDASRRRGLTTGFRALDAMTQGIAPGEVVCIGARTSNAKTALAVAMARRQAQAGIAVGYIPIEGDRPTLTHRMAGSLATESLYSARRNGGWSNGSYEDYLRSLRYIAQLPVQFPDRYMSEMHDVVGWISSRAVQDGVEVFYLDHLDVASIEGRYSSRQAEIAVMMRMLEQTARRHHVAIVFLSQVNRTAKASRLPAMNELREAGAKEEFSQIVLMIRLADSMDLEVRIEKNSEGPTGRVYYAPDPQSRRTAFYFDTTRSSIEEAD